MTSKTKTPICKLCMKDNPNPTLGTIISANELCSSCLGTLTVDFYCRKVNGVKVLSIYQYDDIFRETLYRYKASGDIELRSLFLNNYLVYLRIKYSGYYIVPIPSSEESDKARGFNHVKEAFISLGLPFVECVRKKHNFKQSDLNFSERQSVIERLEVINGERMSGKKILIVDDLFTTGATIKAVIKLLSAYHPKKLAGLTLAYKKTDKNIVANIDKQTKL